LHHIVHILHSDLDIKNKASDAVQYHHHILKYWHQIATLFCSVRRLQHVHEKTAP